MTEAQGDQLIALVTDVRWFASMTYQAALMLAALAWFWFGWDMMRSILQRYSLTSRFGDRA